MSLTGYGKIADSPGPAVLLMLFAVVVLAVPSVVVAADMSPRAAAVDWERTGTRAVEYLRE